MDTRYLNLCARLSEEIRKKGDVEKMCLDISDVMGTVRKFFPDLPTDVQVRIALDCRQQAQTMEGLAQLIEMFPTIFTLWEMGEKSGKV